jgi:DNA-binding CsgD family transcriptional regulator
MTTRRFLEKDDEMGNVNVPTKREAPSVDAARLPSYMDDSQVPHDWGAPQDPDSSLQPEFAQAEDHPASWDLVRVPYTKLTQLKFERSIIRMTQSRAGEALWVARLGDTQKIGVAFKWALFGDTVLLIDPPAMASNILISSEGKMLDEQQHLAALTHLLYVLPWQVEVLDFVDVRTRKLQAYTGEHRLPPPTSLSKREQDCLVWCAAGKTADETAQIMSIAVSTVQKHLMSVRQKLGCVTLAQTVHRARATGWL